MDISDFSKAAIAQIPSDYATADSVPVFPGLVSNDSFHIGFGPPPTLEEEKEWARLKQAQRDATTAARKAAFEKLPPNLREFFITANKGHSIANSIRSIMEPPSDRLIELSSHRIDYSDFSSNKHSIDYFGTMPTLYYDFGLSLEELEKVHADACAEEMLRTPE